MCEKMYRKMIHVWKGPRYLLATAWKPKTFINNYIDYL